MSSLIINRVIPAIRMLTSREKIMTARFDNRDEILVVENEEDLRDLSFIEPSSGILVVDETTDPDEIIDDLLVKLSAWFDSRIVHPDYILIKGIGLVAIAADSASLNVLLGGVKEPVLTVNGRVQDKIVIVTGGAQGFGGGIAELMYAQGANVVIADLNEEAGGKMAELLNEKKQSNQAYFIKADVTNPVSVEAMVAETVRYFGGLDVIISNAGILRAGGLDEMTPETFSLMTDVNYNGYFLCAKYASAVMKVQARYRKDYFTDIIQINSKSGLKGSNRNFAYAGGKFGGIGLTQSFAMELMPSRIKVNSICPGNFFEGPLWSDPEKGLFVQYLKAGKVPGAEDIEDVKAFYEGQVPAGRGCRVVDVVRAIFYVMEQEYETGQAVPVTGGQNMLN
jgi:NAD(P)-dependent dehydrogenase (short-subunit alcohol dehydrogenase family)